MPVGGRGRGLRSIDPVSQCSSPSSFSREMLNDPARDFMPKLPDGRLIRP